MSLSRIEPLRLVSFNIQNRLGEKKQVREERLGRIASVLSGLSADVICLQEALITDTHFLAARLAVKASAYKPRDDGERVGEGNPVFLRGERFHMQDVKHFWLSETPEQPSRSWGAKNNRIATVVKLEGINDLESVWIANLHLDHSSRLARERSLVLVRKYLSKWVKPAEAALLCGDFNMRPPAIKKLLLTGSQQDTSVLAFHDAAMTNHHLAAHATYIGWSPVRLFAGRIDYCLHTPELRCSAYEVYDHVYDNQVLSDHRILVVDLVHAGGQS